MDVFNRQPVISEDTLHYTLYPPPGSSDKASVTTFAACIQTYVESLLPDFLWHRDSFELKVVSDPDNQNWMLEGTMRVGDCVDDEWCTVWLLREVSAKWDSAISVYDSDGEFLLIEAAEALPAWVKPTNSENRVWIYNSHLHLVPISHVSPPSRKRHRRRTHGSKDDEGEEPQFEDDEEEHIAAEDAVKLVRDPSVNTFAPAGVEKTVWNRISEYPAATRNHIHLTKAHIPVDIARALSVNPTLVQKAVETFYTRDAIQLRAAHRMSRFPPTSSVLSTVKMTRPAYAQLIGQKFFPPKIFGQWKEPEGTPERRWRDTGMKIAVGFEMLFQEGKNAVGKTNTSVDGVRATADANKDALRRTPEYVKYIENLVSAGYFRGEVEGSQVWKDLEDKAATTFVEVRREDDATRPSFASMVTSAISQSAQSEPATGEEDSDSWLDVDAENFEAMLQQTVASKKKSGDPNAMEVDGDDQEESPEDRLASEQAMKLRDLASKVEQFVEGEGDLEGAKFDDEEFSDEEFSDDPMSDSEDGGDSQDDVQQDIAARKAAMDKLVPGLEASDYGKMPASFHNNSQKVAPTTIATDVVDDVPEVPQQEPQSRPIRQPILPRDQYDGVDSDDESDMEEEEDDPESEEERPQVVGDIEVDMGEEEDEFLEFSRQALGITDEHWNQILSERKDRGAFVPTSSPSTKRTDKKESSMSNDPPKPSLPRKNPNPNLDSFEAVMQAMDAELATSRPSKGKSKSTGAPAKPAAAEKGKRKAKIDTEDEEEDIDAAMDAELKAALGDDADEDSQDEEPMDYGMIKNFLESFKSQAGLSGPVSSLAGILQPGLKLPRDDS